MNNSCETIVLRHQDFRENDVILTVYTKEFGKLSFLARGLKKATSKNAAHCSLFCHSIFHFNDNEKQGMQTLKNAERKNMFRHIYEDLNKQAIAQVMCECIEKIGDEPSELLFEILLKSLTYLNDTKKPFVVLGLFLAHCNEYCGIRPNVDECIKCHRQDQIAAISLQDGGFLCLHCMDGFYHERLSEEQLRSFRLFHKADIDDFYVLEKYLNSDFEDIKHILLIFEEYSGVQIKSAAFLEKVVQL